MASSSSSSATIANAISQPQINLSLSLSLRPMTTLNNILRQQPRTRFLTFWNSPQKSTHSLPQTLPIVSLPSPFSSMASPQADSASQPSAKTVRVVVKGRVQGVFYRNWTVENAKQLGLKGWVRNRRDGSVEALFSGNPDSVTEMEQRCRRGPPAAVVTGFEVFTSNDDPGTGFERKQTA